jgi:hypothetical protein
MKLQRPGNRKRCVSHDISSSFSQEMTTTEFVFRALQPPREKEAKLFDHSANNDANNNNNSSN